MFTVEFESVSATVATTPSDNVAEFMPQRMQEGTPAVVLQEIDLPAAVAALAAVTVTAEKSEVE